MHFSRKKVFWLSLKLLSGTFLKSLKDLVKYDHKSMHVFLKSSCYFHPVVNIHKISSFMKIDPAGAVLLPLDRPGRGVQTDKMKLTVASLICFEKEPKIIETQHELRFTQLLY